jgi:hypothetical protein
MPKNIITATFTACFVSVSACPSSAPCTECQALSVSAHPFILARK